GDLGTGEGDVPAVGLAGDGHRLDGPHERAGPPHRDPSDFGQDQVAVVQVRAVALLLVGDRVGAVLALKAGKAGLLSTRRPAEEGVIGLVQPGQHILQHVAVDGAVLRERLAQLLQLGFLLVARGALALPAAPPGEALLQRAVVERAAAPQHLRQRLFLRWRRLEFVLERLAHAVHLTVRSARQYSAEWSLGSRCLPCWRSRSAATWRAPCEAAETPCGARRT